MQIQNKSWKGSLFGKHVSDEQRCIGFILEVLMKYEVGKSGMTVVIHWNLNKIVNSVKVAHSREWPSAMVVDSACAVLWRILQRSDNIVLAAAE